MVTLLRKRGRAFKSQQCPEFFKIYLPEHNSQTLLIPPAFIKNFNLSGKIPEKVKLKNSLGKLWEIELEQNQSRMFMKKGWEGYVSDTFLERGEFLIFRYDGDATFTVKVFSIDGCPKVETIVTNYPGVVKANPEERSDQVVNHHTRHDSDKSIAVEDVSQGSDEAMKGIIEESNINSKIIRFAKVDDGKRRYQLHIPGILLRKHKITLPKVKVRENVILRDQSGFSLQAIIYRRPDNRVELSSGWRDFYVKNKISKGDEYEFEIILDEGRNLKEMVLIRISRKITQSGRKRRI